MTIPKNNSAGTFRMVVLVYLSYYLQYVFPDLVVILTNYPKKYLPKFSYPKKIPKS